MGRRMQACAAEIQSSRSRSSEPWSCSRSGARRGPGGHRGVGSSHPTPLANLPTFSYVERHEIYGIRPVRAAFASSYNLKGAVLCWTRPDRWHGKEMPVRVRKFGETAPSRDERNRESLDPEPVARVA